MQHKDSLYPGDWQAIAEQDLKRVNYMLDYHDAIAAGFYLQQAIEKFLKAFLLSNGWSLRRIHDLEILLNSALTYDTSLEQFRSLCQRISDFYFADRYPFTTHSGINEQDIRDCSARAIVLIEKLRMGIKI